MLGTSNKFAWRPYNPRPNNLLSTAVDPKVNRRPRAKDRGPPLQLQRKSPTGQHSTVMAQMPTA